MESFNPDLILLIVFVCAIPILIVFLKKSSAMFSELALHYNGTVFKPYLGIAFGVELPFGEHPVIFDPYGQVVTRRKDNRRMRSSLVWQMPKPFGPQAISIERSGFGIKISALALAKKIRTNDTIFDQEFDVICRDEAEALQFLTTQLRELLMAKREILYALEIEDGHLIVRHRIVLRDSEQSRHFIDEGIDLLSRMKGGF
ncbi:MAG: hypothetical protein JW847_07710 [Candidatus Omnitrophica bacterium]|nr:hypothetical protein [Candidatus Omnitrophota bacterium]